MNDSTPTQIHQKSITPISTGEAKSSIDMYIGQLLDSRINAARQVSPHYEALWQAINDLYFAGGKRMRPYMTLLAYSAFGGERSSDILPTAAAQELLHQAMLIHDDIIDRDIIRYGTKNVTGQFDEAYEGFFSKAGEQRHFAESAAILAGDLLLSEAHVQISQTVAPSYVIADLQRMLGEAVFHVVGGELLDTEASFRTPNDIDPLTIAAQKTATYSFVGPLSMGATLAGAPREQVDLLNDLGNTVGIAFQLRDDIIGIFGDEAITGKSNEGDIREGKQTLLIQEFYKLADQKQKTVFEKIFGQSSSTTQDVERARQLLIETGTVTAVETLITNYESVAQEQISQLDIPNEFRVVFIDLVNKCVQRDK
ncbi:MAG: polyprenyl synthetase family protein [Candidatus Microsaccharimonas sp.]